MVGTNDNFIAEARKLSILPTELDFLCTATLKLMFYFSIGQFAAPHRTRPPHDSINDFAQYNYVHNYITIRSVFSYGEHALNFIFPNIEESSLFENILVFIRFDKWLQMCSVHLTFCAVRS